MKKLTILIFWLLPSLSFAQTITDTTHRQEEKKDWPSIVNQHINNIEQNGLDTAGLGKVMLNNMVYDIIFMHSDDSSAIKKGLEYMTILLKSNPEEDAWIDTYAGLLYKIGRKKEAITQQQKALTIAESQKADDRVKIYKENIQKMKKNIPTWR
ncbi:hypothetical protein [Chitinophaga rhizophila]|uniref:Tetratricopeptide repeat protein n=1 Tax=Chitinophaga rhizophila TaxID=2866212 RepID=A0ABS7G6X7_9BACT|nr:hypothetical protein [Chitinophaga rhizophila]MBW8683040.1 hypothetical protein [Chitinophaga rhizophila]